jgi:hypothetical protein
MSFSVVDIYQKLLPKTNRGSQGKGGMGAGRGQGQGKGKGKGSGQGKKR